MNFKVVFSNEFPFMVNLPSGTYKVLAKVNGIEKSLEIELSDNTYRLLYAPFPIRRMEASYEGQPQDLEATIFNLKLPNYAFQHLKSYITCSFEESKNFSQEEYDSITEEALIERLKTLILKRGNKRFNSDELTIEAKKEYDEISQNGQINDLKTNYLINRCMNRLVGENVNYYYEGMNNFIKQYSYVRKDFFVEQLTVHTLRGTNFVQYIDGEFYDCIKYAGKAPSAMPDQHWLPEISADELETLKNRLENNEEIPPTDALILIARNLLERGEYRSVVIESSAALEIAVEEKLVEKLTALGKSQTEIDNYFDDTKMFFKGRCDFQLKECTGFSFVTDNSALWNKIDDHRKQYRHKIAHSKVIPNSTKAEEIINDFEQAINYVKSL